MAIPITWKNINTPDFFGASRMTEAGGESIDRGLQHLAQLGKEQRGIEDANYATGKAQNTEEALAKIREISTLSDYEKAQQSGNFDLASIRDQYGAQVNSGALTEAFATRDDQIKQEEMANYEYGQQQLARTEDPIRNAALSLAQAGKYKEAKNKAAGLSDSADILGKIEGIRTNTLDTNYELNERGKKLKREKELSELTQLVDAGFANNTDPTIINNQLQEFANQEGRNLTPGVLEEVMKNNMLRQEQLSQLTVAEQEERRRTSEAALVEKEEALAAGQASLAAMDEELSKDPYSIYEANTAETGDVASVFNYILSKAPEEAEWMDTDWGAGGDDLMDKLVNAEKDLKKKLGISEIDPVILRRAVDYTGFTVEEKDDRAVTMFRVADLEEGYRKALKAYSKYGAAKTKRDDTASAWNTEVSNINKKYRSTINKNFDTLLKKRKLTTKN